MEISVHEAASSRRPPVRCGPAGAARLSGHRAYRPGAMEEP
jgi:hypothetical protein